LGAHPLHAYRRVCGPSADMTTSPVAKKTAGVPADPGADPFFTRDADLRRTETYVYRRTGPGDHRLAAGTYAFSYDVTTRNLKTTLASHRADLARSTGIAVYLTGGTALADTDLAAQQRVHRDLGRWRR
jgi:opacity protein-like surface antigen